MRNWPVAMMLGVLCGCAPPSEPRHVVGEYVIGPARSRALRFGPGPARRLVYLNRFGGSFRAATADDSSRNLSFVAQRDTTMPVFPYGTSTWNQVVSCVRELFADFDLEVTESDPGATLHIEAVISGNAGLLGYDSDLGGGAMIGGLATQTPDCSVVEEAIVFAFPDAIGNDPRLLCQDAAQEIAHALGLDHEFLCADPMTYLSGCGDKTFQDAWVPCGEYSARSCRCGATQNSYQILLAVLGPGGVDKTPPTVQILQPQDGAEVAPGFEVTVSADDDVGVAKVDLVVDGSVLQTDSAAPWEFGTPANLPEGEHRIEALASDNRGNQQGSAISVFVRGAPQSPTGGLGAECTVDEECSSGVCGSDGSVSRCIIDCSDAAPCPDDFECVEAEGSSSVCWPNGKSDVGNVMGGCRIGVPARTDPTSLPLITFVLVARARRRRR